MSAARPWCDQCKRAFVDQNAFWQHNKFSHRMSKADNPHPKPRDDDVSHADIAHTAFRLAPGPFEYE